MKLTKFFPTNSQIQNLEGYLQQSNDPVVHLSFPVTPVSNFVALFLF